MKDDKLSGHCYCGSISFEINGESDWVGHCHCESCRRASGSVMTTFAGFHPDRVVFTGTMPGRYTTADGVTRSFCGQCGSPVACEVASRPDEIHMQVGLFDRPERLQPQNHSFLEEKVAWLHADEHLPASGWTQEPDSG